MSTQDYTYNASALGLGGTFTHEGKRIFVPSIASVALAPTGGTGTAAVENYNQSGVSFSSAVSKVTGFEIAEDVYETNVTIEISGLSLFDKLSIGHLSVNINSVRDFDPTKPEGTFTVHASYRDVLLEDGRAFPLLDFSVAALPTYNDYGQRLLDSIGAKASDDARQQLADAIARREPLATSIVTGVTRHVEGEVEPRHEPGNKIPVPGLGLVKFGELIVKPGRRRVNLLRVKFGTDGTLTFSGHGSGDLTAGSGDGNGAPIWPRG